LGTQPVLTWMVSEVGTIALSQGQTHMTLSILVGSILCYALLVKLVSMASRLCSLNNGSSRSSGAAFSSVATTNNASNSTGP
jgi:hypothetical protein